MSENRRRARNDWRMIAHPHDRATTLKPAREVSPTEGYIMVRRPGASEPFVVSREAWENAPARESA